MKETLCLDANLIVRQVRALWKHDCGQWEVKGTGEHCVIVDLEGLLSTRSLPPFL